MNKQLSIFLLVIALLPACNGRKKQKAKEVKPTTQAQQVAQVDIPLAGDDLRRFFDENVDEFAFADEATGNDVVAVNASGANDDTELSWTADQDDASKAIYFDFDKYAVRADQEPVVVEDISYVRKELKKNTIEQEPLTVVLEGHSCHSAGSKVYNLALSNKRAKVVADRFKAEGLSVTTVGRGSEMPALVAGRPITGSREQQAPNRRVEVKVVHA